MGIKQLGRVQALRKTGRLTPLERDFAVQEVFDIARDMYTSIKGCGVRSRQLNPTFASNREAVVDLVELYGLDRLRSVIAEMRSIALNEPISSFWGLARVLCEKAQKTEVTAKPVPLVQHIAPAPYADPMGRRT